MSRFNRPILKVKLFVDLDSAGGFEGCIELTSRGWNIFVGNGDTQYNF